MLVLVIVEPRPDHLTRHLSCPRCLVGGHCGLGTCRGSSTEQGDGDTVLTPAPAPCRHTVILHLSYSRTPVTRRHSLEKLASQGARRCRTQCPQCITRRRWPHTAGGAATAITVPECVPAMNVRGLCPNGSVYRDHVQWCPGCQCGSSRARVPASCSILLARAG